MNYYSVIERRAIDQGLPEGSPVDLGDIVMCFQVAGDELGATEEEIADAIFYSLDMGHIRVAPEEGS